MLLRYIYLFLKNDDYPHELVGPFGFQTRYICNFIQRRVRAAKFKTEGYNGIYFEGMRSPPDKCSIVPDASLRAPVAFDQQRYENLGLGEHHEFFIEMLCEGLAKCSPQFSIPRAAITQWIEEFRRGGYKNEWTHKAKLFRSVGLRASLLCALDSERFVLTLQLERKGEVVFKEAILETQPDEIIFAHQFKDIVLDGDELVVMSRRGKPTFSICVEPFVRPLH